MLLLSASMVRYNLVSHILFSYVYVVDIKFHGCNSTKVTKARKIICYNNNIMVYSIQYYDLYIHICSIL